MARAIALVAAPTAPLGEAIRSFVVLGCALSLIMAGRAFPLL